MAKKIKPSGRGGGRRACSVEKRKPPPVKRSGAGLKSNIESIPLFFTVRKPRTKKVEIQRVFFVQKCRSMGVEIGRRKESFTQRQRSIDGEGFELETHPKIVKSEEENCVTDNTTVPSSTVDADSLENGFEVPGPIPDVFDSYWDDELLVNFYDDIPCL